MATQKELDAYFGGSPSYELYKKLYGGSGSNAGQINNLYDQQIAQQNAYYDAQLQKLAGQNAQQQQALAAENMRAGRGIRYATTQGGLNNSGIQAQAGVLNAIAGQKAQGTLAAQYQQNVADIEADRAQKAYGLDINRQQALLDDQAQAQQRKATYAGILAGYESQMANEQAAAAQAAAQRATLSADNLITTSADELINYYSQLSDPNSQLAQNVINNYGVDAYNSYLSGVGERVTAAQADTFKAESDALAALSEEQAARYYEQIAYDDAQKAALISKIGQANYDKLVKQANAASKKQRNRETKTDLIVAFRDENNALRDMIRTYYNSNYALDSQAWIAAEELTNDKLKEIILEMINAGDTYLFDAISASDLNYVVAQAARNYQSTGTVRPGGTGLRSTLYDNDLNNRF